MHETSLTPYADLNAVLRQLVDNLQMVLNDNFVGAYLQGSFAVGDFDLNSDCDFIVVIANELSDDEVQALQGVHERIFRLDISWAQHLEGSYFPRKILLDYTRGGTDIWYLDHGSRSLIRDKHCNTILVRWVVRENGVTLAGSSPQTLVEPIPGETLRHEIMTTIVGWGQETIANPDP